MDTYSNSTGNSSTDATRESFRDSLDHVNMSLGAVTVGLVKIRGQLRESREILADTCQYLHIQVAKI